MRLIFDLETDGLLDTLTTIHVLVCWDLDAKKQYIFERGKVWEGIQLLQEADLIIGHNIINFDIPAIRKLVPNFAPKKIRDTLLLSRITFTNIKDTDYNRVREQKLPGSLIGSQSLEAWGYRLFQFKGEFCKTTDWKKWTPEMTEYCCQDVKVTSSLWRLLEKRDLPEACVSMEHRVAEIIQEQQETGMFFNKEKAQELYTELMLKREAVHDRLMEVFKGWWKATGKLVPKRDNRTKGYKKGCPLTKISWENFNPNSTQHIFKALKDKYSYVPEDFTAKGTPKLNSAVLERLCYPEIPDILEYQLLCKRLSQLGDGTEAWLKHVKEDNRIHGSIITAGTVTGRMSHKKPNMAQVPAAYSPYGKECRALFGAEGDKVLVGVDASGLELRCLAHYLYRYDGGAYVKEILEGDVHTANQKAAELETRDQAKKFIYTWLYGGGAFQIGETVGYSPEEAKELKKDTKAFNYWKANYKKKVEVVAGHKLIVLNKDRAVRYNEHLVLATLKGQRLKDKFMQNNLAVASLKEAVEDKAMTQKFLRGLDGRRLYVRSKHSSLNLLLQSAGALIMKKALTIAYDKLEKSEARGLYKFVNNVHDEFQIETTKEVAELVGQLVVEAIREVQVAFNLNCPLDGEAKIGKTWADTH